MSSRVCPRCGKTVISEEFSGHDCTIVTYDTQEIGITELVGTEIDEFGDKVYVAQGINGILYRLVECKHNPPHPETRPTVFDSEKNRRRFDRTLKQYSYKVLVPYHTVW